MTTLFLVPAPGCALAAPAQESLFPKPHHLSMKDQADTWDAEVKVYMDRSKPPMVSKSGRFQKIMEIACTRQK